MHSNFVSVLVIATILGFAASQPVDIKSSIETVVKRDSSSLDSIFAGNQHQSEAYSNDKSEVNANNVSLDTPGLSYKANSLQASSDSTRYAKSADSGFINSLSAENDNDSNTGILPGLL